MEKTETPICSTCGCSLVRLGIRKEKATTFTYAESEYYFCCQGCADTFITNPEKYLLGTNDLIVCPTCLAEKPTQSSITIEIAGEEVSFCRCPRCAELYKKDPDFYNQRLAGQIHNEGVMDHAGCYIAPA